MAGTMKQIAELSGVSRGTVDRVLNNRGRVRDEVAERVRQSVDPARDFAVRIVMESELGEPDYLFDYGEYVTDNEIELSE